MFLFDMIHMKILMMLMWNKGPLCKYSSISSLLLVLTVASEELFQMCQRQGFCTSKDQHRLGSICFSYLNFVDTSKHFIARYAMSHPFLLCACEHSCPSKHLHRPTHMRN